MKKLKLREIKSVAQDDTVSKILLSSIKLCLHIPWQKWHKRKKKEKHRTQLNSSKAQAKSKESTTKGAEEIASASPRWVLEFNTHVSRVLATLGLPT